MKVDKVMHAIWNGDSRVIALKDKNKEYHFTVRWWANAEDMKLEEWEVLQASIYTRDGKSEYYYNGEWRNWNNWSKIENTIRKVIEKEIKSS